MEGKRNHLNSTNNDEAISIGNVSTGKTKGSCTDIELDLDAIFTSFDEPALLTEGNGIQVSLNQATVRIFGFDPSGMSIVEMVKRLNIRRVDGKSIEPEELASARAIGGEVVVHDRFIITNVIGQEFFMDTFAAPLYRNNNVVGAVSIWRDITTQEHALKDISESRRQVLDTLESITDGFMALDSLGRVTYINKRAEELLGIKKIDVLFKKLWDMMPNAQASQFYKESERARSENQVISFEEFTHCHGRWLEFHIYPYEHGISIYFSDITERKKTENALSESELHYRTLFNAIDEGFYIVEVIFSESQEPVDYRFLEVNPAFEKQTGLTDAEGKKVTELVPNVPRFLIELHGNVALTGEPARLERYAEKLGSWYDIYAFRVDQPEKHHVAVRFNEISDCKHAEKAREQAIDRLQAIHEITNIATSSLNTAEISKRVLDDLVERLGLTGADILTINETQTQLMPQAASGFPIDFFNRIPVTMVDSEYESARVFCSGKPSLIENADSSSISDTAKAAIIEFSESIGKQVKSYITLPLITYKESIGIVAFFWPLPRVFTQEDVDFFMSIAREIAIGVKNAQLFEAEVAAQEKAASELETSNILLEVAGSLVASLDLDETLNKLAELVLKATGRSRAFINLVDMDSCEIMPKVATSGLKSFHGEALGFDQLSHIFAEAIYLNKTTVLDYEVPDTPEREKRIAYDNDVKLMLFVPLHYKGEIIGHILLDEPGQRHKFAEREIEIAESIASQAAVAIENARLHAQTEAELSRTKLLQDIAIAASSSTDLKVVADEIISAIRKHVMLKIGIISMFDETNTTSSIVTSFGLSENFIERFQEVILENSNTLTAIALKDKRVLTQENDMLAHERLELLGEAGAMNDRYVIMPIEYRDDILGVLALAFDGKRSFTKAEFDLFHAITHTIGQAMENARIFEVERYVANTLQNALLTMPDEISGIKFGYLYHAAKETAQVGGDFYDIFEIERNKIGIVIGDVSGKGLDAAVLTSRAKNALKAFSYEYDTPAEAIIRTNDILVRDIPQNIFITLFFGCLDTKTGQLIYCSAGHPPAIVKRPSGIELLEEYSPIVGAFPRVDFENNEALLHKDDVLVLYTDGVTEAHCGCGFFGEERLLDFVRNLEPGSPTQIPQLVFDEVMKCTNGKLSDDLALLSVSLVDE